MATSQIIPFESTHPGSLIKDELDTRKISQKEFALDIDMHPTMLNELIKGKRAVTAEIALLLEKALGIPADYWLRFQAGYDLDCARLKERNIQKTQQIEIWSVIKQYVPVGTFEKLGYLTNAMVDNIARIWEIYDVNNVDGLIADYSKHTNLALYKKSDKLKNDQINILGWSKLAQWLAKAEELSAFNPKGKDALIAELKEIFRQNKDVVSRTKQVLNDNGIKFLVVEKFKQSPIDGYSFWSHNNPAIVVTMRKKHLDNFAYTIMHELGHVFEHLKPNDAEDYLEIDFPQSHISEKEDQAHAFAQQCFIDNATWNTFITNNSRFNYGSTEWLIKSLADRMNIHPSILLGRYRFETNQFKIKTEIEMEIH